MRLILIILILNCILQIELISQDELPFNHYDVYYNSISDVKTIIVTESSKPAQYSSVNYYYFDSLGRNYLTKRDSYGREQSARMYFNDNGLVTRINLFGYLSTNQDNDYWDSEAMEYSTTYDYDDRGFLCTSQVQYYDRKATPNGTSKHTIHYDSLGRKKKEIITFVNIDNPEFNYPNIRDYKYVNDTIYVDINCLGYFKQKFYWDRNTYVELLLDVNNDTVRITNSEFDAKKENIIQRNIIGHTEIDLCHLDDPEKLNFNTIRYIYSLDGLISSVIYSDTRYSNTKYVNYRYIK